MSRFRARRPSAALIVSFIALLAALGGTSYAALSLPKNSVGTKQLKKNSVTTPKIKNGAVTASKINATGLTVPNATHAGSAASATNAGHASTADSATNANKLGGAPASSYLKATITEVASGTSGANSFGTAVATCPSGYQAIGGGVDPNNVFTEVVTSSAPVINGQSRMVVVPNGQQPAATGWEGAVLNNTATAQPFKVGVVCAPTG